MAMRVAATGTWMLVATLGLCSMARSADESSIGRGVGKVVADFTLRDVTTGKDVSLYGFRGKKAAVIVFGGVDCPVGNLYMPRLAELAKTYRDHGVVFLLINANAQESAARVAEHAKSHALDFPVLKDDRNVVADQLMIERTCEAVVLDASAVMRYRGAIDDQYGLGARRSEPSKRFVADALDAILAAKPVETSASTVVGCPIDRVASKDTALKNPRIRPAAAEIVAARKEEETKAPVTVGAVTYAADVAQILQNKCQSCHRPKQAAPFSLLSYDDAKRWSGSIQEVVEDRRMPPWHADPRYGHFENDRSLSARERAVLLAWVEQGTPLGDPARIPPPRTFVEGWTIGKPDVVFSIPEQTVQAQGTVNYMYFRVPTGFTEDKWVSAIEPRPGDRAVVHHIIIFLDDKKGRREHLAGYAPGEMPSIFPPGVAKRIPAGSDLVFQVHYTPVGKIKLDQSIVGFTFANEAPKYRAVTRGIAQQRFQIPPGAANHEVRSSMTFNADARLLSFMPHMHLRGKDFVYTAVYPDGRREILLSVPAYDFAWQSYYRLAEPKIMPKGAKIECVAHFDNSEGNLANPDPKATVRWGDQTYEEMMIGYIDYIPDAPIDAKPAAAKSASAALTRPGLLKAFAGVAIRRTPEAALASERTP
jgi:peroxiredoxin